MENVVPFPKAAFYELTKNKSYRAASSAAFQSIREEGRGAEPYLPSLQASRITPWGPVWTPRTLVLLALALSAYLSHQRWSEVLPYLTQGIEAFQISYWLTTGNSTSPLHLSNIGGVASGMNV